MPSPAILQLEQPGGNDASASEPMTLEQGSARPEDGQVGDTLPLLLAAFGSVVLIFTLVRMYRRRLATRHDQFAESPAERIAEVRQAARSARSPLDELMADATELATQLSVQLDSKAAYLEQLLDRAEAIAERLERASGGSQRTPGLMQSPKRVDHDGSRSMELAGDRVDPMHHQIYALADEGLDSLAIAQKLGQPKGQVELVLKLRRA